MPRLQSDLHEDYARARAQGLLCKAAYARAGYEGRSGGYAYKINGRSEVKARVAELIALARLCDEARPEPMIVKLMELAQTAAKLGTGSGLNAAKGLLAEAAKLRQQMDAQLLEESNDLLRPEMSEEEWFRTYAPQPGPKPGVGESKIC
jgi:hypothetical protein